MQVERLFFVDKIVESQQIMGLPEDTAKHMIQVLRMKKGEEVYLCNGKGFIAKAIIVEDHKKHPQVKIEQIEETEAPKHSFTIAIALTKNASRFEWFLEKATEMGITQIIPLKTHRTEKQHFRYDRMNGILISAMMQSQQTWLPKLWEPLLLDDLLSNEQLMQEPNKYIAHCLGEKQHLINCVSKDQTSGLILIGPEGDFTPEEIEISLQKQFQPVSLGDTRLRTETAGMLAAGLLMNRK